MSQEQYSLTIKGEIKQAIPTVMIGGAAVESTGSEALREVSLTLSSSSWFYLSTVTGICETR
ncbi:hypothetical protein MUK42_36236 [Musa troglodytarum]|uniref:Uncharacterized protein n=1 Tax=Musa troglodytarum TaxID=320322 RepID=A0A9E7H309_9LILI|nr:hypothetical protein MUK42_36236 [Musa troglodytarum]